MRQIHTAAKSPARAKKRPGNSVGSRRSTSPSDAAAFTSSDACAGVISTAESAKPEPGSVPPSYPSAMAISASWHSSTSTATSRIAAKTASSFCRQDRAGRRVRCVQIGSP